MRVPEQVHLEAKKLAALQNRQAGDVLAEAWREYLSNHREQFAADLEESARLLREGTVDDLAAFASRTARERAEVAADRASSAD